ncbi:trypsin [Nitzschia inconspicua]|uniref:Trypsin n=1 Tax=Nitzschia inconspicua TaxID=303405 RepID=A0A9K3Q763_9STRA|nr:trypsin [Nitzschia inconspicua]
MTVMKRRRNELSSNTAKGSQRSAFTQSTSRHESARIKSTVLQIILLVLLLLVTRAPASAKDRKSRPNDAKFLDGSSSSLSPRIVGGTEVTTNVPFMVWLQGCSATLVHKDVALTAAHCSQKNTARIGIRNKNEADGESTARIEQMVRHPDYDSKTYDYDFALIKLSGWFQDNQVIQLNRNAGAPALGDGLTILGFGGQSEALQQGVVQFLSPSDCRSAWGEFGYEVREDIVLCAYSNGGVDACAGDSGGPLLDAGVQVGVISSGSGCDGLLPTTYARVSAVIDWIEGQVCELSALPPTSCPGRNKGGASLIRVDIVLDEYPEDIEWRIQRGSNLGEIVASGGSYDVENVRESVFVALDDGIYAFTIEDIGGFSDGLGESGSYRVVEVNDEGKAVRTIVFGSRFGDVYSTLFALGVQLTPAPSISPTSIPSTLQPSLRPITNSPSPKTDDVTLLETATSTATETSDSEDEKGKEEDISLDHTVNDLKDDHPGQHYQRRLQVSANDIPSESFQGVSTDSPSTQPSISVAPSNVPSISIMPSDEPSEFVVPTVEELPESLAPTDGIVDSPTGAVSAPPMTSQTPSDGTELPSVAVSESPSPTAKVSDPPTTGPSDIGVIITEIPSSTSPTGSLDPPVTTVPSATLAPTISDLPTTVPSDIGVNITETPSSTAPTGTLDPPATTVPSATLAPTISDPPTTVPSDIGVNITETPSSTAPTGTLDPPATTVPSATLAPTISDPPTTVPSDIGVNITEIPSSTSPTGSLDPPVTTVPSATVAPDVTDTPSLAPSNVTVEPSMVLPTQASATPTGSERPSNSFRPTVVNDSSAPSSYPSDSPSEAPTRPLQRYLIAVSLLIVSNPRDISWRVVDFETDVQQFGYRLGWYETTGFSVSVFLLVSGTWEFLLVGSSDDADAILEFGILDTTSGLIENLGTLNLADVTDGSNVATAIFSLE